MKSNGIYGMNFILTVALACSRNYNTNKKLLPDEAAAQIKEVLEIAFSNTGYSFDVQALTYPICSKIPLVITVNDVLQRLLWFYPQMSITELAEELSSLMFDIPELSLCATA